MPASRRARAMIFAPRSCPSSPGLAIKTRIFLAGINLHCRAMYLLNVNAERSDGHRPKLFFGAAGVAARENLVGANNFAVERTRYQRIVIERVAASDGYAVRF